MNQNHSNNKIYSVVHKPHTHGHLQVKISADTDLAERNKRSDKDDLDNSVKNQSAIHCWN